MDYFERQNGEYRITTDPSPIDLQAVHAYLAGAYWSEEVPQDIVARAIESSLCFSLLDGDRQIGFARVVTDRATFAYLCDVYVLEEYRGKGLGKWLIGEVMSHPDLQGLRRFILLTRDAHGLYSQFGFTPLGNPDSYMEIARPGIYKKVRN